MLIRNAEIWGNGAGDVRLADGRIAAIGHLAPLPGDTVLEAGGGALLPGLHDHHIHLPALAARQASVVCGPPAVRDAEGLAEALAAAHASGPGEGWIRGILYHESVMGLPDAAALDRFMPHRPLRIQHRSGRMWLLNSLALEALLAKAAPPPGLEREGGRATGRLFDADGWLRDTLGNQPPALGAVSQALAAQGITGVTEMSPGNDGAAAAYFAEEIASGALRQRCLLAGTLALAEAHQAGWRLGPAKLHLHESALPDFDATVAFIAAAHAQSRALASHCTTETELVFTLAALEEAGARAGDRIEHAGIAPDHLIAEIASLGVAVVSQPHFIAERGDQYRADVEPELQSVLYRLRGFLAAGVPLAAGSDAPFGSANPWAAMRAACQRATPSGAVIGGDEALSPEEALALYLADPEDLPRQRRIAVGEPADLCLLDRPWREARLRLSADDVRATLIAGAIVHQRIHQPPA
jgi:predicted amidohydrolase YtcJ